MQSIAKETYFAIVTQLDYGNDASALACSCRLLSEYHRDLRSTMQFRLEAEDSLFYANYRLSDHQISTLRHLLLTEERQTICLTPKGAGRKITALVYANELYRLGMSVVIAVPSESLTNYCVQAEHLGVPVSTFKKAIKTENFSAKAIYVVDRSNTYQEVDFERCGIGCLILDAPDKGKKSFLNFCQDVALCDLRTVLLANSISEEACERGCFEVTGISRTKRFFSLRFATFVPEMKKRIVARPETWFYLCFDAPGSYYSVTTESKRGIWSQDVLQDIVRFRAKKPAVLCMNKKVRLEIEPLISARYFEMKHVSAQLSGFSDYIFYNFVGTEEKLRHLISKLPWHQEQPLRIWIITDTPSLAYSVIPPKEMVDTYREYMARFQSSAHDISSVATKSYKRNITLEEATVLARKSAFPKASADWLALQKGGTYTFDEIVSIIREKKCLFLDEESGCSVKDLEPVIVHTKSNYEPELVTDNVEERQELEAIVANPTKKGLATVDELRRRCRLLGISPTGKKQELAKRLLEHSR